MKGYKDYKTFYNVPLKKDGFNSFCVNGNTKLGKIIRQMKKELKDCVVWYRVDNVTAGTVTIIYKKIS